jgi:hypothetical protein
MDSLEISEKIRAQAEEINRGAPIPAVSAFDMKQMWNAMLHMNADFPPDPNCRTTAIGVFAAYGVEAAANRPEEFMLVSWRHRLLSSLVEKGVLNDYKHGEELDERVFCAAATMPCDIQDIGETMLPLLFAQSPPEMVAKAREEMLAHGYNLDKPNLEGKFLNWLRDNC